MGRYAEALEEVRRGHELGSRRPGWNHPSAQWVGDAERLVALEARVPAVLKGDDRPASPAEGLTFAQMCASRKLYAASAKLYAEVLDAEPTMTNDRQAQHRYHAACAAALAGSGEGNDDPPPDPAARAKLRGQALGWLKAELAAWTKSLEGGGPEARAAVRRVLLHWKVDPALCGVGDEAGLAKVPEAERNDWRAVWSDAESLVKKAE